jgi:hypothetical protein
VRRWLVLSLGLGIAAVAGYALLSSSPIPSARQQPAGAHGTHADRGASHDEIGQESRARLEEILRDANAEEKPLR